MRTDKYQVPHTSVAFSVPFGAPVARPQRKLRVLQLHSNRNFYLEGQRICFLFGGRDERKLGFSRLRVTTMRIVAPNTQLTYAARSVVLFDGSSEDTFPNGRLFGGVVFESGHSQHMERTIEKHSDVNSQSLLFSCTRNRRVVDVVFCTSKGYYTPGRC